MQSFQPWNVTVFICKSSRPDTAARAFSPSAARTIIIEGFIRSTLTYRSSSPLNSGLEAKGDARRGEERVNVMAYSYRFSTNQAEAFGAFYAENGFFAVDPLFDSGEVETYRRQISAIIRKETPTADRVYVQIEPSVVHGEATAASQELSVRKIAQFVGPDPVLTEMAHHPELVKIVTALLGPDVKMLQDMALLKPPFFGSRKTWHQDCPYFPVEPPSVVGCW